MFQFRFLKKFSPKSEFTKNTATLILGTVLAQVVPLLLHPILRRIYTPEEFGVFAVYLNIISIIVIMATLRYEAAIVLPKNNVEAANILSLSFIINFLLCSCFFVLIVFLKDGFCSLINFPLKYSNWLYLLPFSAMFMSFYQSLNYWLIRQKAFKAASINKISRRGVEGVFQLGLGFKRNVLGLITGDVLGNLTNLISGVIQVFKNDFKVRYISKNKIVFVLKKYKKFPIYNFFPTLLSSIANSLPFIFINKFYSSENVGYIDLSRLVLSIPLAFISVTVSQVIFQQITSKKNNRQSIKKELIHVLYFILAVAVLEYFVIQFTGPQLFSLIFGDKYYLSGQYSQILMYGYIMNFIISTYSSIFISFEKLKLLSVWQIAYFLCICSLFLFHHFTIVNFIEIYTFIEVSMDIIYCFILFTIIRKYEGSLTITN
jgi:O-antigen/teichoic acid export membrane protein